MPLTAPTRTPVLRLSEVAPLSFTFVAFGLLLIPDMAHAEIIGVLASVLAFAVFIPQAVRVWRSRNDHHALLGVSITSFVFIVNNSIVWGLYAWTVGEFWVGAAGIINLPLAVMIVTVIIRSRIKSQVHPGGPDTTEQEDPNHACTHTVSDLARADDHHSHHPDVKTPEFEPATATVRHRTNN